MHPPRAVTVMVKSPKVTDSPTARKNRVVSEPANPLCTSKATQSTMAASVFAQAVDALVAERDRMFIERIAHDYNLPVEELKAKYITTAAESIKIPRQYKKREPKAVTVIAVTEKVAKVPKAKAEKQCCTSQTSKKEPCKFSALKGEVFCKRHLKQSLGNSSDDTQDKPVKKAAKKGAQPVHTHVLTNVPNSDCDLCQSHGNPLENDDHHFEVVTERVEAVVVAPPAPATDLSVEARLAAMLTGVDDEEEEEIDSGDAIDDEEIDSGDAIDEEEFEEDDD